MHEKRLAKGDLKAAQIRASDLASVCDVMPHAISRMMAAPGAVRYSQRTPGAILALVFCWAHLPADIRLRLLGGEHLKVD